MRELVYVVQMVVGPRTGSTNPSGEGPDSGNGTCGIVDHDSPPRMFLLLILEEALSSEAIKMWTSTWKAWYLGNLKNLGWIIWVLRTAIRSVLVISEYPKIRVSNNSAATGSG